MADKLLSSSQTSDSRGSLTITESQSDHPAYRTALAREIAVSTRMTNERIAGFPINQPAIRRYKASVLGGSGTGENYADWTNFLQEHYGDRRRCLSLGSGNGRVESYLIGIGFTRAFETIELSNHANARASSWNRPPIDRIGNLNVEAGTASFAELIASVERGVYMSTNCSWSIDDSRNKFQFGCEWGRLIEDGQLTTVVKNPNYRGISATFWRNLKMVGNAETFDIMGTPFCGKGEPNQVVRVGHASPACLFADVDVFGGE